MGSYPYPKEWHSPSAAPTQHLDCDPRHPPCAEERDFFGICWKYHHCPYNETTCDPEDPPCLYGYYEFDSCWAHDDCLSFINSTHSDGNNDGEEEKDGSGEGGDSGSSGEAGSGSGGGEESGSGSEGGSGSGSGSGTGSGTGTGDHDHDHDHHDDDFWEDWNWDWFNSITPIPTAEPTYIHDCDPNDPPCARYEVGVCVEYEHCFGVHSTPHNTTKEQFNDDEGYTFEPTKMPVPHPTPAPSLLPTSTPTTSSPTPQGWTAAPTISMMPTAMATAGPTSYVYCNPEEPPCDNYFFGGCLGKRYCYGSHNPTPMPTSLPASDDLVDGSNNATKSDEDAASDDLVDGSNNATKSDEDEDEGVQKSKTNLKSRQHLKSAFKKILKSVKTSLSKKTEKSKKSKK